MASDWLKTYNLTSLPSAFKVIATWYSKLSETETSRRRADEQLFLLSEVYSYFPSVFIFSSLFGKTKKKKRNRYIIFCSRGHFVLRIYLKSETRARICALTPLWRQKSESSARAVRAGGGGRRRCCVRVLLWNPLLENTSGNRRGSPGAVRTSAWRGRSTDRRPLPSQAPWRRETPRSTWWSSSTVTWTSPSRLPDTLPIYLMNTNTRTPTPIPLLMRTRWTFSTRTPTAVSFRMRSESTPFWRPPSWGETEIKTEKENPETELFKPNVSLDIVPQVRVTQLLYSADTLKPCWGDLKSEFVCFADALCTYKGSSLGSPCLTATRMRSGRLAALLCVMCLCPECKPRPRPLRHTSTQVTLLHKEVCVYAMFCVLFCCASVFERLLQVCCSLADGFQLNFVSSGSQKDMRPERLLVFRPGVTFSYSDQTLLGLWGTRHVHYRDGFMGRRNQVFVNILCIKYVWSKSIKIILLTLWGCLLTLF